MNLLALYFLSLIDLCVALTSMRTLVIRSGRDAREMTHDIAYNFKPRTDLKFIFDLSNLRRFAGLLQKYFKRELTPNIVELAKAIHQLESSMTTSLSKGKIFPMIASSANIHQYIREMIIHASEEVVSLDLLNESQKSLANGFYVRFISIHFATSNLFLMQSLMSGRI